MHCEWSKKGIFDSRASIISIISDISSLVKIKIDWLNNLRSRRYLLENWRVLWWRLVKATAYYSITKQTIRDS